MDDDGWPMDRPLASRIIDRKQLDDRRNERLRSAGGGGRPANPTFVACANQDKVYPPRTGRAGFTRYYRRGVSDVQLIISNHVILMVDDRLSLPRQHLG